ncbi:WD40-repeat-containing domain protein [Dichotomopilus funicola]|uniref:WD40-repeat-containing domain protein n=1 Tax=Dichotomopilus funicola TaxID=1934379 RepID=A0AAN6ZLK1_9PEZI|nr:WD40-repeat-containing domain protein [Dichotomopilus funicola]
MQSADPEHFFETDAALNKKERRAAKAGNKYGSPIVLKSKILAAIPDPRSPSSAVLVAESAGAVRLVNLDDPTDTKTTYRGPTAPISAVAIGGGPNSATLFAGSWDRAVWSWDLATKAPRHKYAAGGHTDFVKALVCATVGGQDVLISGGADKKILVWDIATGRRLHTLQDVVVNMLSVQALAVDYAASTPDEAVLFSASSDPHIRRWKIRLDGWEQVDVGGQDIDGTDRRTILEHETTVYKLVVAGDGNQGDEEDADLWTASGDGTAKCLARARQFACEDTFQHGDHVRALAVTDQWVITAGRDEDIKIWDKASGKLYCALVGHYDEVTELVILRSRGDKGGNGSSGLSGGWSSSGDRVCSVSIDGTVRTWPLEKAGLDAVIKEQQKPVQEEQKETTGDNLLSAEEEAELAELMGDDE